jgi:hypothetical protein
MRAFSIVASIDRIHATCIHKKIELNDNIITHPTGKVHLHIGTKTTFTIEGDLLHGEQLIRDIAVLALDQPYYPVTMEEVNFPSSE